MEKKPGRNNMVAKQKELKKSTASRIRPIGNSNGVILNNHIMEAAGLRSDSDIVIEARDGVITIMQKEENGINTDLTTWDKQFKSAKKRGAKPESDLFEGMENDFDSKEW